MLKKILLALDGSESAEQAFGWMKRIASLEIAQVVLFRAVDPTEMHPKALTSELESARTYLLRMEKEVNYAGYPSKVLARRGTPALAIVEAAMDERCDLIVMASRGTSKIARWTIGGVADRVLRLSGVPVLIVQKGATVSRGGRVRRMIVPVDGSALAELAVPWVVKLAKAFRAEIVFLHVYSKGTTALSNSTRTNFQKLRTRMIRLTRVLKRDSVKSSFQVRAGDAADRILAHAGENDMIITTTQGRGGLKKILFGSVAEKLIHESPVPVLVYKTRVQGGR